MTPPTTCPICESGINEQSVTPTSHAVSYVCGLVCREYTDATIQTEWRGTCINATQAALRCGATLRPTPLEKARQDAIVMSVAHHRLLKRYPYGRQTEDTHEMVSNAATDMADALEALDKLLLEKALKLMEAK